MPAATAAADPLDEPPGVCDGACGLRVGPGVREGEFGGHRLADGNGAGGAQHPHGAGIEGLGSGGQRRRAMAGGHAGHVDHILDADGHAGKHAAGNRGRIEGIERLGRHDVAPCPQVRLAPFDGGQALARRRQRPGLAAPDAPGNGDG
nr:hypothetical protein [Achromobacter denitrificans]